MNYTNLPVYIAVQDDDPYEVPPSGYLPAQNISVDYQAENNGLRILGDDIDINNQFTHGGALQAKISFNSYINTETSEALQTILDSSGDSAYKIRFGNNVYRHCYLSDYNITVEPFRPAVLSANYIVHNAPKENFNGDDFIDIITVPASTNNLLYSESLNGDNYVYSFCSTGGSIEDPTGGYKAISILGQGNVGTVYPNYSYLNTEYTNSNFGWVTLSGDPNAVNLVSLQTDTDLSVAVNFVSGKTFEMGAEPYPKIWISNNGIFSFFESSGYSSFQQQDFPILNNQASRKYIAAYWRNMFAGESRSGSIWYKQTEDRFIIEYDRVWIKQQITVSYQIHLFFATGVIEIKYHDVPASGKFSKNATIGIQWAYDKFINSYLQYIKNELSIVKYTPANIVSSDYSNLIYNEPIKPKKTRIFSIYLKRSVGSGDIKYTTNGGTAWNLITPALTTNWERYVFPATDETQKIGIQIETLNDVIYAYGAQLEDYSFATPYIPTTGSTVARPKATEEVPVDIIYPKVELSTGFANTMINGNNCSVSSTTGFVSAVQSSIRYNVNCARSPIYSIGSTSPSYLILDSVEKQMDISSTELQSFVDFSGSRLGSNLELILKDAANITGSVISMNSGANIYSQKSSVQENETLTTEVSIKEIVL